MIQNEPTPTQGYGVSMGNNLMIDSRVGELISLRDLIMLTINFIKTKDPLPKYSAVTFNPNDALDF